MKLQTHPALLLTFILSAGVPSAVELQGTLIFAAAMDGNWDLFLLRFPGHTPFRLTETPLDERFPALSPSKQRAAFAVSDGSIGLIDLDTKKVETLRLPEGRYGSPAWLDEKTLLVTRYATLPTIETSELVQVKLTAGESSLFLRELVPIDHARPSPSGNQLAYVLYMQTLLKEAGLVTSQDLAITSLIDGLTRRLSPGGSILGWPSWSPAGDRIVFACRCRDAIGLVVADVRDSKIKLLNHSAATNPMWSPDGRTILYVSRQEQTDRLMVLDVDSLQESPLETFNEPIAHADPHWR